MRVRCSRLINALNEPVEASRSLTIGKEYVVLEISASVGRQLDLRIIDDTETYSLWSIDLFEVTTPSLPSNWIIKFDGQRLKLCPSAWARLGFWEDYFNDDRDAIVQFQTARDRIIEEDSFTAS
jgi:hypothetical protein